MSRAKNSMLFFASLAIAIITFIACLYYAIPGYYHVLVSHDPLAGHPTHAIAFAALCIGSVIAALVNRPRLATRY